MKAVNGFISIVLVLSLMMGVYCANTKWTYSIVEHLRSISQVADDIPELEEIGYIWRLDMVTNRVLVFDRYPDAVSDVIHLKEWPSWGLFKAESDDYGGMWYHFHQGAYIGNSEFWNPVENFLEGVHEFGGRCFYSLVWLAGYAQSFFDLVFTLSPTSGLVERSTRV